MPTYLIEVVEHRTYEIEADTEVAAMERARGDPEELPIGSLVSLDRSPPQVVRAENDAPEKQAPVHPDATSVLPSEFVRAARNRRRAESMPERGGGGPETSSSSTNPALVMGHSRSPSCARCSTRPATSPHADGRSLGSGDR